MNDLIEPLFRSGRVADIVLAVMVIETLVLVAIRVLKGRGFAVRYVISNMMAGLFLVLALKAALVDAAWPWIAASLSAAFAAHVADLSLRWPPG